MKRIVLVLLAVLLLTGCAAGEKTENTPAEPVVEATTPVSIYMANSSVEQQTGGAVKVYVPQDGTYIGMGAMNGKVVLVTDLTQLILMDAQTGELGASVKVGETISCQATDFTVSDRGISYYREQGRELVFLNTNLQREATVEIPEGISGHPCVSHTNQEVYYCKDKEVRAMDLQTGISRIVKRQVCETIELEESHLDGTMLACKVVDEQGRESMLYLNSADGQTMDDANQLTDLQTGDTQYLVTRTDGPVQEQIYGAIGKQNHTLTLDKPLTAVFQMNGGYCWSMDDSALVMDFYDFNTGTHSAHVRMVGVKEPISVAADDRYIWVLAKEGETEMLYRWEVALSPTGNNHSYLEPLYTRQYPDAKGLEQCAQRAKELEDKYGFSVTVGKEALAVNGGYDLVDEFQVPVLADMLQTLEKVIVRFPEGFLKESLVKGNMHFAMVRSISGDRNVVQFYENGEAYILVAATGNVEANILHGIGYIIDSHVLGNSRDYDTWKGLNPSGFDYDYGYANYKKHEDSDYLTDEYRAFTDAFAMTFPHEDRCRLFVYAMMENNTSVFANDTMQAKLKRMCQGIRESYGYERDGNTYPWEQYLNISLAHRTY